MRLQGRVAIVTGAGRGIGAATALKLAAEGAAVVVAEVDVLAGERVTENIAEQGGRASFVRTDVSDAAQIRACVDAAIRLYGQLDVLVNNAGVNFVRPTLDVTLEDWDRVLDVDLRGTFLFCQEALRHMAVRRTGSIINLSSVHARSSLSGAAPYAAAKGGVSAMTRSLAVEFGPLGIRVNAVCPGLTSTEIWKDIVAAGPSPEAVEGHWRDHIALDRVQEPEEVAEVILFLASDQSTYITGSELYTDGGMTAMLTQRKRPAT
jgi:NAD(P)-dependent dehydrogenase (short-subunit alcohol dehydrogenase family)